MKKRNAVQTQIGAMGGKVGLFPGPDCGFGDIDAMIRLVALFCSPIELP